MGVMQRWVDGWRARWHERGLIRQLRKSFGWSRSDIKLLKQDVGAFIEKKSYTPVQLLHAFAGVTKWSNFNRFNAITNGLQASVWVYACTTTKAVSASSVPFRVKRKVGDDWVDEEGPLQALLDSPNPEWTWSQLVMQTSYHRDLSGVSYITKIRGNANRTSLTGTAMSQWEEAKGKTVPVALWAHDASAFGVRVDPDGPGLVRWYEARRRGLPDLEPSDVMPFRLSRPDEPWHSLSPFEAAWKDVQVDTSQADFQKSSMDNRAVLSGVLGFDQDIPAGADPMLGYQIAEDLKTDFDQRFKGPDKAHGVLVMPGKYSYTDIAKNPKDLDFIEGRKLTRENICAAFGVPPVLVGILDRATYSNFQQAELAFWRFAIIPFLNQLKELLNQQLVPEFGSPDELTIEIDLSGVEGLWQLYHERVETAALLIQNGFPHSQVNDICRLRFEPWDGWDNQAAAGGDVQQTALNGAQVGSLHEIMRDVGLGALDPDAAIQLILAAFPTIDEARARSMVSAQVGVVANVEEAEPTPQDPPEDVEDEGTIDAETEIEDAA